MRGANPGAGAEAGARLPSCSPGEGSLFQRLRAGRVTGQPRARNPRAPLSSSFPGPGEKGTLCKGWEQKHILRITQPGHWPSALGHSAGSLSQGLGPSSHFLLRAQKRAVHSPVPRWALERQRAGVILQIRIRGGAGGGVQSLSLGQKQTLSHAPGASHVQTPRWPGHPGRGRPQGRLTLRVSGSNRRYPLTGRHSAPCLFLEPRLQTMPIFVKKNKNHWKAALATSLRGLVSHCRGRAE